MPRKKRNKKQTPAVADLGTLLSNQFNAKHIDPAINHFTNAVSDFGQGDWEGSIAKSGKFVEAILKAMATHCSVTFEAGRKFKADKLMNDLGQLPHGSFDDSLRLLIPRACRVIYDIASNRGARHDPDEVDPNSMDANVVMPLASSILAEAIRYSQKGVIDPFEAELMVEFWWSDDILLSRKSKGVFTFILGTNQLLMWPWLSWPGSIQNE